MKGTQRVSFCRMHLMEKQNLQSYKSHTQGQCLQGEERIDIQHTDCNGAVYEKIRWHSGQAASAVFDAQQ